MCAEGAYRSGVQKIARHNETCSENDPAAGEPALLHLAGSQTKSCRIKVQGLKVAIVVQPEN
jgi:hypothetical protein